MHIILTSNFPASYCLLLSPASLLLLGFTLSTVQTFLLCSGCAVMFLVPPVGSGHALPKKSLTIPVLSIPCGSGEVQQSLPRGIFSGALRWPHPLLGPLFISSLPCFNSQDISLPKHDIVDPVYPMSLSSSDLRDAAQSVSPEPRTGDSQMLPECFPGQTGQVGSL